jgi:hypothetical protein
MALLSMAAMVAFAAIVMAGSAYQSASKDAGPESKPSSTRASAASPRVTEASTRLASAETRPASAPAAVSTQVGCLRAEDDGAKFVLTDVEGENAPQKRNWKTLFVTKKAAKLVVEPAGTVRLEPHVGRTVQLTGTREDNVFEARSLRVVRHSCS